MEEIYSPPLLKTIMAKAKGRAPFTMKGFSYPGQSPLQDAKQQTMRDLGTAGGRERVEQTRPYGSSGGSGRSWIDTIPSFMGALSGGSGGGGMFGAIAAATSIGSLFGGRKGGRGRRLTTTRGDRGYSLGTTSDRYVSQHQTLMTS